MSLVEPAIAIWLSSKEGKSQSPPTLNGFGEFARSGTGTGPQPAAQSSEDHNQTFEAIKAYLKTTKDSMEKLNHQQPSVADLQLWISIVKTLQDQAREASDAAHKERDLVKAWLAENESQSTV
jgi:hypothetical protein